MSQEIDPNPGTPIEVEQLVAVPPAPALPPQPILSAAPEPKPAWRAFIAPAWFLFGILVGLGLFAAYAQVTAKPAPQPLDAAQVQQAAHDGLLQAIQELQGQSSGNNSQGPQTVDKNVFTVRAANILGNQDAKVSIVEFADFQCPYCGRHHQSVEPSLVEEYVKTGKANIVYKHLAFLGPESVGAAVAAECAADQGKFWEYHDYLFEHQAGENQGAFTQDKLLAFGKDIGLDSAAFEKCVKDGETLSRVQADTAEAQKFGVGSTPTFFVNGEPLVGLKSPDEFKQLIDKALAE